MSFRTDLSTPILKTGGIEVIEKTTQPFPKVEPGHIVVKVCAAL